MQQTTEEGVFKPRESRQEHKSDATTRAAREIIDGEIAARVAKTERLRAARLAHAAAEQEVTEDKAAEVKAGKAPAVRRARRKR